LVVRPVADAELDRFRAELGAHHWLGFRLSGQVMRYVAVLDGQWGAVAGVGSAALSWTGRGPFLGWDTELRLRRLPPVGASPRVWGAGGRLGVPPAGGGRPGASAVGGACRRRRSSDSAQRFGHPVLAVETSTAPARHTGACYAAAGFSAVGQTAGYARNRGT